MKYWFTINEPNMQVTLSYRLGCHPPAHCSQPFGNCSQGNSEEEPFIAAHNLILSHATAVDIYRTKYQVVTLKPILAPLSLVPIPWISSCNKHIAVLKIKKYFSCKLTVSVKVQKDQGGSIGIILNTVWFEPISNSTADKLAAERAQSFYMNWLVL